MYSAQYRAIRGSGRVHEPSAKWKPSRLLNVASQPHTPNCLGDAVTQSPALRCSHLSQPMEEAYLKFPN